MPSRGPSFSSKSEKERDVCLILGESTLESVVFHQVVMLTFRFARFFSLGEKKRETLLKVGKGCSNRGRRMSSAVLFVVSVYKHDLHSCVLWRTLSLVMYVEHFTNARGYLFSLDCSRGARDSAVNSDRVLP